MYVLADYLTLLASFRNHKSHMTVWLPSRLQECFPEPRFIRLRSGAKFSFTSGGKADGFVSDFYNLYVFYRPITRNYVSLLLSKDFVEDVN